MLNIYTDSRYTFAAVHVQKMLYKEYGVLIAEGKQMKNKGEISQLLIAIWKPKKAAIIHRSGN